MSGVAFYLVGINIEEPVVSFILINTISVVLSLVVAFALTKRKNLVSEMEYHSVLKPISICIIPLCVVLSTYSNNHKFKVWYNLFITVFVIIVILYFKKVEKAEHEIKLKEMELNITRVYGGMFEDVISDIRRKQHNYKEQIAAIYSTHKTAQSLDELIEYQKGYCDMLQEDSKYDFILTACHEPILAGFIYYKCLDGLSKNIIVECNIRFNQWDCEIKLYQLI